MQLNLAFLDDPEPPTSTWEQIDPEARTTAIEVLARLLAQAVRTETPGALHDD
ncbi:MAG: hypothetical protein ACM35F_06655 [Betaproteobacteria bacterium]